MTWTDSICGVSPLCHFPLRLLISMQLSVPGKTDPYAISLVKSYRAFFVLNALFALIDRRVTIIRFLFASVFVNFLHYIEKEWTLLVDCIEKGIIPDMENMDHVRETLEVIFALIVTFHSAHDFSQKHFTPNPLRAAELREIGPPEIQGWAVRVWPDLKRFIGVTGGSAAASVPKVYQVWRRLTMQLTVSDLRLLTSSDLLWKYRLLVMPAQNAILPYHIPTATLIPTSR